MLYVYRTTQFLAEMVYAVNVENMEAGLVHHHGYRTVPIEPGERMIQLLEATYLAPHAPLRIQAEAEISNSNSNHGRQ